MLNFLKKTKQSKVVSPVNGQCVDLSNVPDKMFSERILGDGVAFVFDDEYIFAPSDGEISMIADTKHAVGMTDSNGMEILIHIGLDTVNLKGEGFEVLVDENQKVEAGTKLVKVDRELMRKNEVNLITPVVLTNGTDFEVVKNQVSNVQVGDTVITATKNS